jgi:hypothetical protein
MASTGVFGSGGIVEFAPSLYGTDDDPMDTVVMRDGVHHGLHHGADSMAQVRVNFVGIGDDVVEGQTQFSTIDTPADTSTYYLMDGSPFGPWPLTVRADGTAYKLRYRIAGSVSDATGGPTGTIRVIIHPHIPLTRSEITQALDSSLEATFTTTTATWASGAAVGTLGSDASDTILTVSSDQIRGWIRDVSVFNAVSSPADGRSIQQVPVAAHVYAKIDDVTKLPQLRALHIQEFIG